MGVLGDFAEGATELPRNIIGGLAVALGADEQKTKDFLGLNEADTPLRTSIKDEGGIGALFEDIKAHPAKFAGEITTYALLPTRLLTPFKFFKKKKKLLKLAKTKHGKRLAITGDTVNQAATLGIYSAAEDAAVAKLNNQEAHPVESFVTGAAFVAALTGALHGAMKGSAFIKNKAMRNKYVRDFLVDSGFDKNIARDFATASDADRMLMLQKLHLQTDNNIKALQDIYRARQTGAKLKLAEKPVTKDTGEAKKQIDNIIEKTGAVPEKARPLHMPKTNKLSPIAQDAKHGIARLRAAADDVDAHKNQILRISSGLGNAIREMLSPESRKKITHYLDTGEGVLTQPEKEVADLTKEYFLKIGHELQKQGIIKDLRKDYVPHLLRAAEEQPDNWVEAIQRKLEPIGKRSKSSTFTERNLTREDPRALSQKENALTTDIADLLQIYSIQTGHAAAERRIINALPYRTLIKPELGNGHNAGNWIKITEQSHPAVISGWNRLHDKNPVTELYVHKDVKPSLDLLFEQTDFNTAMKAAIHTNFAMKRLAILGSLFHFNALAESALFAKAGGFGAVAKGAGVGYLLSGANPLGAAVGAGLGAGAHVLVRTRSLIDALRQGKYGDEIDFALRYVDLKPPRDVGNNEWYQSLRDVQDVVDKYVPSKTAGKALKKGVKTFTGINKAIDVLMWHRLMAGAKLQVFYSSLERLEIANMKLPMEQRKTQHELALAAGQFTNDAFGGQNWRRLAEGVDNAFGRRIAAAMAKPAGQQWANLIMFAPDWTISNLRIIAKAFPGINSDKLSRKLYQRYATRAAIYYMLVGSAVQMALTGKPIWMNEDPTRIDLGDGRTMTFSKQLMEPFHWLKDPLHEGHVKTSSIIKAVEEQTRNRQYVAGNAPHITHEDDALFEAAGNRLKIAGEHFAPIFVQDIGRNGLEGVYGFFGHPIYGHIRYGFKKGSGTVMEDNDE